MDSTEPDWYPPANHDEPEPVDANQWSSARVRWPIAALCLLIAAINLVPAALIYAEWRFGSGAFAQPRGEPPILECSGLAAVGIAFVSVAAGLLWRRWRYVVAGLVLFLVTACIFIAYQLMRSVAS